MADHNIADMLMEFYDKMASWEGEVVRGTELSPAQMHAIEIIGGDKAMKMRELAARLGITTGTLTVTIDKLEKKGLVARVAHESDRRSWLIVLTDKGQERFLEHHKFHHKFTEEITEDLSESETRLFAEMMAKIVARM